MNVIMISDGTDADQTHTLQSLQTISRNTSLRVNEAKELIKGKEATKLPWRDCRVQPNDWQDTGDCHQQNETKTSKSSFACILEDVQKIYAPLHHQTDESEKKSKVPYDSS